MAALSSQGARTRTVTWLGTARIPGQLVLFCAVTLVSRVHGLPPTRTVNAAVLWLASFMTVPEAMPVDTPGLSPFENAGPLPVLCAGAYMKRTVATMPLA